MVSGQTYHALDNVTVLTGQTLNIPEGVTILFYGSNAFKLQVDGVLNVTGTDVAPVTFRSYKDSAGWNSWKGIEIGSSATSVSIDGAIVKDAGKGVYFNDAFNLNSSLTGHIVNSRIENNYTGIYINRNSSPLITNDNVITDNGYGVQVYGSYSTVNDPAPVITYNSIYDNSYNNYWAYYFANASNTELDATYNWWGTIDTAAIDSSIYDNADYATYSPVVNYTPYLDGEGGNPMGLPDQPTAVISGPVTGLISESLNFDGSGSTDPQGDPLTFAWDMGDGTLLNGATVNHSYSAVGTYTVSLTVSDGQLDHTATQTVTITDGTPPPAGVLSVESTAGAGQSIHRSEWVNIYWTGQQPPASHTLILVREATGGQATTGRSTDMMTYDSSRNAWYMQFYIPSGVWLNEPYFFKIVPTFPEFSDPDFGTPESERFVIVP
jgi:PKD repeat protein